MKVVIKFPENNHEWIRRVLKLQESQGFITVKKACNVLELIEPSMPRYLLSSLWIEKVIEK